MKQPSKSKPHPIQTTLLYFLPATGVLLSHGLKLPPVCIGLAFFLTPILLPAFRAVSRPRLHELKFLPGVYLIFFTLWTLCLANAATSELPFWNLLLSTFFLTALPEEYFFRMLWFRRHGQDNFSTVQWLQNILIFTVFHFLAFQHPISFLVPFPTIVIIYFWKSSRNIWVIVCLHTLLNLTDQIVTGSAIRSWMRSVFDLLQA